MAMSFGASGSLSEAGGDPAAATRWYARALVVALQLHLPVTADAAAALLRLRSAGGEAALRADLTTELGDDGAQGVLALLDEAAAAMAADGTGSTPDR